MRRRYFLALSAASGLTGCAGTPTIYYRLQAMPGAPVNIAAGTVLVRGVTIPGYLDQTNNVQKPGAAFEVNSFDNAEWAEPLADMLQAVMVQDLAQRLPAATVISDGALGPPARINVAIDVQRFDFDPDGTIRLIAQLAVKAGNGGWVTTTYQAAATPAGTDAGAVAATMSGLWGAAADRISAMVAAT
jgi:uncharacterized lipoprotein YmbA